MADDGLVCWHLNKSEKGPRGALLEQWLVAPGRIGNVWWQVGVNHGIEDVSIFWPPTCLESHKTRLAGGCGQLRLAAVEDWGSICVN